MSGTVDRAEAYRIFNAALDLAGMERAEFIERSCGANTLLRQEIAALLNVAADTDATGLLLGGTERPLRDLSGQEYGRFRLLELIGTGGMGVVYRAERTDGVPQSAAIKLLRGEISAASSARFVSEARILARLEHPAIARLIDVGVRDGEGWIALELVRGRPIDEYCDTHQLDLRERVRLLAVVAGAVAAAHRNLVVHRDLKPTNVLVTDDGNPKLIDFGIASAITDSAEPREPTADIRTLFTPNYAAPEQVRGEPVTVATDVFGLGALAYRLLSGRMLFADSSSAVGYLLAVIQRDVEPPSRAALTSGMGAARANRLRGDIDAIVLKALEREPSRRYASAQELQADFERYLHGLPVSAHAPSPGYRFAKFVRRRVLAVSLVGLLFAGLITSIVIYALQARSVEQARDSAARRGEFLESMLKSANPDTGQRDITVAALLDSAAQELDSKLGGEPLVEASMLGFIAKTNSGLGRYTEGHAANDRQLAMLLANGGQPLEIARALLQRGELYRGEGKWLQSEVALRDAVARLRVLNSPPDLCLALDHLGVALMQSQREAEAQTVFLEEIAIESRGDATLRNQRIDPWHDLAIMLGGDLGHYAEAETYARKAWDMAQQALPLDAPDRLAMENGYAITLMYDGKATAAEPLIQDALTRQIRVLGVNHHDTLVTRMVQAQNLLELHRDAEAATVAEGAAAQFKAQLGPDNIYALMAAHYYGTALCRSGKDAAGLAALRDVATARRRLLPAGDRLISITDTSVGVCLDHLHRYAESETTLLAAAAALEAARGPGYRQTQDAFRALNALYRDMNRPADAARWAGRVTP